MWKGAASVSSQLVKEKRERLQRDMEPISGGALGEREREERNGTSLVFFLWFCLASARWCLVLFLCRASSSSAQRRRVLRQHGNTRLASNMKVRNERYKLANSVRLSSFERSRTSASSFGLCLLTRASFSSFCLVICFDDRGVAFYNCTSDTLFVLADRTC